MQFLPYLNTQAGGMLTAADWQDAGVKAALLKLDLLLMKPGADELRRYASIHEFCRWHGQIGLDISTLPLTKDETITVISSFDGSRIRLDSKQLLSLIRHLKADFVLMRAEQQPQVQVKTPVVIARSEDNHPAENTAILTEQPWPLMLKFKGLSKQYIISDRVAEDARQGVVYTANTFFSITDNAMRFDYSQLENECLCSTCAQKLTRSYFHHLYAQVPFLCQRFLLLHNLHIVLQHFNK